MSIHKWFVFVFVFFVSGMKRLVLLELAGQSVYVCVRLFKCSVYGIGLDVNCGSLCMVTATVTCEFGQTQFYYNILHTTPHN